MLAAVVGVVLLAAFWLIEQRSPAPLVPPRILARRTVKWGNFAGLVLFAMEPAVIFLTTLYLQRILGLSPLGDRPGLRRAGAGVGGRGRARRPGHRPLRQPPVLLAAGLAVEALATVPLLFLGPGRAALLILLPALFVGFFGHVAAIVAYTVTATSGLPDEEQGLATGLTSMTQQVGITVGIPVLSAVAATQAAELTGIHLALGVAVVLTLASVVLITVKLKES